MRDDDPEGGRHHVTAETTELTCREVTDFLDAYLDGELRAEERLRFDEHLAECPDCRTYLRQYEVTIALAKDACGDAAAVAAGIPESLVEAILASSGTGPRRRP
jgi:predicted anti-sigma-YlaC factor YlaD